MEPISKIRLFFDFGNIMLSFVAAVVCLVVVMKTEKELKKVFEYFFISLAVVFVASILEMNKYFNIISEMQTQWVLVISRFLSLLCKAVAFLIMLGIVRKQIQCDFNQPADAKKQK